MGITYADLRLANEAREDLKENRCKRARGYRCITLVHS